MTGSISEALYWARTGVAKIELAVVWLHIPPAATLSAKTCMGAEETMYTLGRLSNPRR